ncbi:MAG: ABC transporter ATP-binding protein, partial [Burkholderiaceae bacterium]
MLEIRNVCRRFGEVVTADNVSFAIEKGEFFSLVGPSGCGKTTLLRMIAGFDAPDSGDILLDGKSLLGVPPEERPIHTVFQSYALFPHLTVTQNIGFPLKMKGNSAHAIDTRVTEILALVALSDKADHFPQALSGGQRQRVALARAIADLPHILLLDEPLAALDAKLREQMQVELIRLQRDLGITFVFVTHSQAEALSLSHRIGVMTQGRIEQVDDPARIYGFPKNRFVADFIGHCALVGATVTAIDVGHLSLAT